MRRILSLSGTAGRRYPCAAPACPLSRRRLAAGDDDAGDPARAPCRNCWAGGSSAPCAGARWRSLNSARKANHWVEDLHLGSSRLHGPHRAPANSLCNQNRPQVVSSSSRRCIGREPVLYNRSSWHVFLSLPCRSYLQDQVVEQNRPLYHRSQPIEALRLAEDQCPFPKEPRGDPSGAGS